ncbi:MAG: DeoR family transcriptional regulator [Adlercreutzia sp.]
MLSERRQRVLRALIEDYIEYALPVGSRTLTERHRLGVSPATVRNDLSALEDAGFIQQPHTSAGRVPTDAGYRTFVDELLSSGLAEEERPHQAMVDELRASASELDALMERTSAALARLTNCLSIAVMASVLAGRIRHDHAGAAFASGRPSSSWWPRTARWSTARSPSPTRSPPTSWQVPRTC